MEASAGKTAGQGTAGQGSGSGQAVRFAAGNVTGYNGSQNVSDGIEAAGDALALSGNTWARTDVAYDVTEGTLLEFEFRTDALADLVAIGVETDDNWKTGPLPFKLAGRQKGAFEEAFDHSSEPASDGWTRVVIDLGKHHVGSINALTFINDHDAARPDSGSAFRAVRLHEAGQFLESSAALPDPVPETPSFSDATIRRQEIASIDEDEAYEVFVPRDGSRLVTFTDTDAGTLERTADGGLTYTPGQDFHGLDGFTYMVADGDDLVATYVELSIDPLNDAPVAGADALVAEGGAPVTADLLANDVDVDGDALRVARIGEAGHGAVRLNADGTVSYSPDAGFSGQDTFTYAVSDGEAEADGVVTVTVEPAPDGGGDGGNGGNGGGGNGGGVPDPVEPGDREPAPTEMVTRITHEASGVTYHFAKPVEAGHYWNGDIFVVNNGEDVVITRITPESDTGRHGGILRTSNGAVIQPGDEARTQQGFDSYTRASGAPKYVDDLNVDPGNSGKPLTIRYADHPEGASLVKAISNDKVENGRDRSSISEYSVLTVVDEVPPKNAFRPPVEGRDKTSYHTIDDLDLGKLQDVDPVKGQKDISEYLHYAEATFVSWDTRGEPVRALHPSKYHIGYGDYQADKLMNGFLALHSDVDPAAKLKLYAAYVQIGLDYNGAIEAGNGWHSDGGHNNGFKPFVVLAGVALDDDAIKANAGAGAGSDTFSEDEQFFYVGEDDIGAVHHQAGAGKSSGWGTTYVEGDLGLPEWKLAGYSDFATPEIGAAYRKIASDGVPITALVMEMLGDGEGKQVWNNDAYFDYADRIERIYNGPGNRVTAWDRFYDQYHDAFKTDADWTGAPERIEGLKVKANGAGFIVDLPDFTSDNGSPILRTDLRYGTNGKDWTVVEGVGDKHHVDGVKAKTFYYVQARHVNDLGEGAWSGNLLPSNSDVKSLYLDRIGVDTRGSQYFKSKAYQKELADLLDGFDSAFEANLASKIVGSSVLTGSGKGKIADVQSLAVQSLAVEDAKGAELLAMLVQDDMDDMADGLPDADAAASPADALLELPSPFDDAVHSGDGFLFV